jgi:hypothetical protein
MIKSITVFTGYGSYKFQTTGISVALIFTVMGKSIGGQIIFVFPNQYMGHKPAPAGVMKNE